MTDTARVPNAHTTAVEHGCASARPSLVLNPADDTDFARMASALLDGGERSSLGLQLSLRASFPDAVVHERDLSGESLEVWYVFRHGRWIDRGLVGRDDDDASARTLDVTAQ